MVFRARQLGKRSKGRLVHDRRPRVRPRLEALERRDVPSAFFFSTGNPDGLMASASRPTSGANIEIETGDDFILNTGTQIQSATFVGMLPTGAPLSSISDVRVEIYRVFPKDSNTARTITVPTRTNSPSDVEFDDRDQANGNLTFTASILNASFSAANSVLNGIHPSPNQTTGGEGMVSGEEAQFSVTFTKPFDLPADHYFFVPQVQLSSGNFFWLSAPKPIVAPGTPFSPDLQAWVRNENLQPDWLRIGTDIVGGSPAPTFNMTFSLSGQTIPPPAVSVAFGPFGEVVELVDSAGNLTQFDESGPHFLGGGVRSASVAFFAGTEVLLITSQSGVLTQFDAFGVHTVRNSGVLSASVAFGPAGEVMELVTDNGFLFQLDAAGILLVGGGVQSAAVAIGPFGYELAVVSQNNQAILFDAAGAHFLGGNVGSLAVTFDASGLPVADVIFTNKLLFQFDSAGSHFLGPVP
jgi:hypothetical protein